MLTEKLRYPKRSGNIETLNGLLRGEMAAIESYRMALSKPEIGEHANAIGLRRIQKEHVALAESIRKLIFKAGGQPEHSSGPWGVCAKAVTATAHWLGKIALVNALREGEEMGVKGYRQVLLKATLEKEGKELVELELIPVTRSHIPLLTRILETEISHAFES